MRTVGGLWVCGLLMVAACSASEAGEGQSACVPGRVVSCPCVGAADGVQVCTDDGSAFGDCECGGEASEPDDAAAGGDESADSSTGETPSEGPDASAGDAPGRRGRVDPSESDVGPVVQGCAGECGTGGLTGLVCAPSKQVFVTGATVEVTAVDCDGVEQTYTTSTDNDGLYHFDELPCGTHEVHVSAGQFTTEYEVVIEVGVLSDVTGAGHKLCFAAGSASIAVFWGQWDHMQDLLTDLGFTYDYFHFETEWYADVAPADIEAFQVLMDPLLLGQYQILFFNCGSAAQDWITDFPQIRQNLAAFVESGGSIYASDLSWAYVEGPFPDAVDFLGDDDLPSFPMADDGPQQVEGNQWAPATIVDDDLAAYVSDSAFEAWYGPGPLIAIADEGPETVVHVQGIVQIINPDKGTLQWPPPPDTIPHGGPIVVSFQPSAGAGRVVYSTFHNDEQAHDLMTGTLYYLVFLL